MAASADGEEQQIGENSLDPNLLPRYTYSPVSRAQMKIMYPTFIKEATYR